VNPRTIELFGFSLPETVPWTLALTASLALFAMLASRRLELQGLSLWQTAAELFCGWIRETVREIVDEDPAPYVPLIGTLMLFIASSNILSVIPFARPPTAELSTTAALAVVVFVAVPVYGIRRKGLRGYMASYMKPNPILLPLNLLGEVTRTVALAVRLFGNVMSGQMIGAILLAVAGALFPVPLLLLGLLTGIIQAYIFGILAAVYIAAALQTDTPPSQEVSPQ
jgi:F-type H+-transporting ATPase subunit a